MRKETIKSAFERIVKEKKNFRICTNNAVGHGLNGVSFNSYVALKVIKATDKWCKDKIMKITDVYLRDTHMEIHYECTLDYYFDDGTHIIFIDYENVVGIDLVMKSRDEKLWPDYNETEIHFEYGTE